MTDRDAAGIRFRGQKFITQDRISTGFITVFFV